MKQMRIVLAALIVGFGCISFGGTAYAADKTADAGGPYLVELCSAFISPAAQFCTANNGREVLEAQAAIPAGTRFVIENISGYCAQGIREIGGVFQGRDIYYPFTGGGSETEPFNISVLMYIDSNAPLGPGGWDVVAQSTGGDCRVILTGHLLPLPK